MTPSSTIIIGIICIATLVVVGLWRAMRRRGLSGQHRALIQRLWAQALSEKHDAMKVMQCDAVLAKALTLLGFTGSLGEMLKKSGPRFSDVNAVWSAHKLRNVIAHETSASHNASEIQRAIRSFERALHDLGM